MGIITSAIIAASAIAGAAAGGVATHQQTMAAKTQKRVAANIREAEVARQQKEEAMIAEQERVQSQRTAGILRATAGKRAGRRSLISGPELGLKTTLG